MPKKSTMSCLNNYRPVTLTPIIMKCFERLITRHIKILLPPSLDHLHFAYCPNCSKDDDDIAITLYLDLTNLDRKDSCVQMMFIDFSLAFTTIIPQHLIEKLSLLGPNTSLYNRILNFLTGRPQDYTLNTCTALYKLIHTVGYCGSAEEIINNDQGLWMYWPKYKRHLSTTSNSQTPNSTMAKTKELSKDTRNKIVDLHQAGKTESAIVEVYL
ncbi:hypothetical protein QTP70_004665 [Hemibagrus guttatus]|uniref:Reverse transcriptase domain-containing protein n=1 Tax=Hemibagrus guttatus TaxID=175788 RepID=A0AAE0QZQ4_9TELE|nr:hypothetical protein QTP70_004665 [Hemibagrus guttatus]